MDAKHRQKIIMRVVIAGVIGFVIVRVGFGDINLLIRVLVVVCGTMAGAQLLVYAVQHGWRAHVGTLLRAAGSLLTALAVLAHLNILLVSAAATCMLAALVVERRGHGTA
jgi:hypothetical protein